LALEQREGRPRPLAVRPGDARGRERDVRCGHRDLPARHARPGPHRPLGLRRARALPVRVLSRRGLRAAAARRPDARLGESPPVAPAALGLVDRAAPRYCRGVTALERILSEHRTAVEEYLAAAGRVPEGAWTTPRSDGKWSPCQITEHLCLTLEGALRELSGGPPFEVVLPFWKRWLLRRRFLRPMLASGNFPQGVKA